MQGATLTKEAVQGAALGAALTGVVGAPWQAVPTSALAACGAAAGQGKIAKARSSAHSSGPEGSI